jgi:hypothetical protein
LQFYHNNKNIHKKKHTNTHTLLIYFFLFLFFSFFFVTSTLQIIQIQKPLNKNYITLWKLQKQPLKNPGICWERFCEAMDTRNSGGASSPRATTTGGAWVHAPPQAKNRRQSGLGSASLLLPLLADGEDHRHLQPKENAQAVCFS